MNRAVEHLITTIEPAVMALGFELVGCELNQSGRRALLRVYIDKEGGVTVDDCTQASRQISAVLDVEDPINSAYELEVSSPGLDRPLMKIEHFTRFIGKRARVKLRQPIGDRRNFSGEIIAVQQQQVIFKVDDDQYSFDISNIDKANLVPEF